MNLEKSSHVLSFIRFGIVGGVTAAIYFIVMWVAYSFVELDYMLSVSVAYVFSTGFHFFANKYFTFRSPDGGCVGQILRYLVMWLVNYFVTIFVVWFVVGRYFMSPYFGVLVSVFFTMVTGYILGRYWVFKV